MSEHPPVFEHGSTCVAYADVLVIEQHGPVCHLMFAYTQREPIGSRDKIANVACRVIVPTAMLPRMAQQLVRGPEMGVASDDVPELAAQH
jgi:hypothetical protein